VLIEGRGRGESYTGRTERNEIVHVACHGDPTGELLDVRITEAYNNSLRAEPTDPSQRVRAALVTAVKQSLTRALPVI
jgi:tRNA A37 methylthiotransferase MiaB